MVAVLTPTSEPQTVKFKQFAGPDWLEQAFADQRERIDGEFGPGCWQQLADDTDAVISAVIAHRWNPEPRGLRGR